MSRGFIVRPQARRDIVEIAGYIAANRGSARRFRREGLKALRLWRISGRFEKYLVVYRPRRGGVEVIRVLHGARSIERLLGR